MQDRSLRSFQPQSILTQYLPETVSNGNSTSGVLSSLQSTDRGKEEPGHCPGFSLLLGFMSQIYQRDALSVLDPLSTPNSVKQKNLILERLKTFGYLR